MNRPNRLKRPNRPARLDSTTLLDPESTTRLLAGILTGSPRLPDALCRDRSPEGFDGETTEDVAEAIGICGQCPELAACRAWAARLPDKAVSGVVAGEHREWYAHESLRRPCKAVAQ